MPRVFLTGATGFIGSYIAKILVQRGFHVLALKRKKSSLALLEEAADRIEWINASIFDFQTLLNINKETDYIIHSAGKISMASSDEKNMFDVNAKATANLVNIALDCNIKKFVHISSIAALGKNDKAFPINEIAHWEANDFSTKYGESKMHGEMEVWRGMAEGMSGIVFNPSLVIGGGFWNRAGSCAVIKEFAKGRKFYPTGGTGVVDVRDVAKVIVDSLDSSITQERFILSSENISFKKMMTDISQYFNKPAPKTPIDGLIKSLAPAMDAVKSFINGAPRAITKQSITNYSQQFNFDNSKSIKTFDISYRNWSEMYQDACQAYKKSIENRSNYGLVRF